LICVPAVLTQRAAGGPSGKYAANAARNRIRQGRARSPRIHQGQHPVARAIETLPATMSLFLLLFA
jgi:hypothetical protein